MYNEDDAVAKLDGYVVSVAGAATLVGEKTLVRIEKVGRSAAEASLVNPPDGVVTSAADGAASADGSPNGRRRRRGRRGGRGRRKKAETGSSSSSS
jgi:ribonuclease G